MAQADDHPREEPALVKSPLRRRIAAVALVLAAPAAAGCTNGFDAQTDQPYQPAVGVNDQTGSVDALNAAIVSDTDGIGTLSVTLLNNADQPDQLVSVTGSDLTAQFSPIELPTDQLVDLSKEGQVAVSGPKVSAGEFVTLELVFRDGGSKEMTVPVVPHAFDFGEVPLPSGSPSATQ
jgi:copper(I)-binding protein